MLAQGEPTPTVEPAARPRLTTEIVLEVLLVLFAGAVFTYLLLESVKWHPGVALLPRVASGIGYVFLIAYAVWRFRSITKASKERAQIMDLGFDEVDIERRFILGRTVRMVGAVLLLFAGVWLIGFHLTIPIFLFGYLMLYGQVRWWWALTAALFFEAYIVGVYDTALRAHWPDPIFQLLPPRS